MNHELTIERTILVAHLAADCLDEKVRSLSKGKWAEKRTLTGESATMRSLAQLLAKGSFCAGRGDRLKLFDARQQYEILRDASNLAGLTGSGTHCALKHGMGEIRPNVEVYVKPGTHPGTILTAISPPEVGKSWKSIQLYYGCSTWFCDASKDLNGQTLYYLARM